MYVECPWKTLVTELVTRTKYIFADKKRVLIISRQALMICLQQFHVPSPKQLYFSTWKKLTIEPFYNQLIITIIITTLLMKYIAILRYWILTYLHWLLLWSTCFISSLISYHRPTLFCCNFKAQWLKMQPGPLIGFSFPFLSVVRDFTHWLRWNLIFFGVYVHDLLILKCWSTSYYSTVALYILIILIFFVVIIIYLLLLGSILFLSHFRHARFYYCYQLEKRVISWYLS